MIDKCELFCITMSKKVIFAFAKIVAKIFFHIPWLPFPQQLSEQVFRCGRSHWFRSFPQAWLSCIAIPLRLTGVFKREGVSCLRRDALCLTFTRLRGDNWRRDTRPGRCTFLLPAVAASTFETQICLILLTWSASISRILTAQEKNN